MIATAEQIQEFTLTLPTLYPKQHAAIFSHERYAVIEASTKAGKTVGCIAWLIAQAIENGKEGRNFWWIAPIYQQAKIAFRRMRRMFAMADPEKRVWDDNKAELTITLGNGAVFMFKSSDNPDGLYGEDVYAAVFDEATRAVEDAWFALRSTLTATKGPVRIIGNVKGRKNWVYHLARKAQAGEPHHHYAKLTAYDAVEGGVLDADEVEDAKRQLPEHVFRELYLAEPAEDGGNPFGLQFIRQCMIPSLASGPVAYWGIDVASTHDWTVAIGLNTDGHVCAFQRWQGDWNNVRARIKAMVKGTPALLDSTGVGKAILDDVQVSCPMMEGYDFGASLRGAPNKQRLMEGLAFAIQNRTVKYPDGVIVSELEAFEYDRKASGRFFYAAPEGMHDDCVCALALAVMCMASAPKPVTFDGGTNRFDGADPYATDYDPIHDEAMWTPC